MTELIVTNDGKISVSVIGKPEEAVALLAIATKAVAVKVKMQPMQVLEIVKNALDEAKLK